MKSLLLLLCFVPAAVFAGDPDPAKTDWFLAKKYGVFVHYLASLQNNPDHVASLGRQTSWDECVREFDVAKFADRMREAGAGYVIFTVIGRVDRPGRRHGLDSRRHLRGSSHDQERRH